MTRRQRSGFTLVECAIAGAVVVVALALLGLMAGRTRKMGQLGESMANLRRIGELTGSYGNDYQERFAVMTWRRDRVPMDADPDLFAIASTSLDYDANGAQVVQILRRRLGRPNLEAPTGWMPHVRFTSLVLAEYAQLDMPSSVFVSPGDACRVQWMRDPLGPLEGRPAACVEGGTRVPQPFYGLPYSWSYEMGPAFLSPDTGSQTINQASTHWTWQVPTVPNVLGDRRVSQVRYPSQKAHVWDANAWYCHPNGLFSLMIGARFPVLSVDGGVRVYTTRPFSYPESNTGGNPLLPTSAFPISFSYEPATFEPPIPGGRTSISVYGHLRWTRYGLMGRDFDGPEVRQP